MDAMAIVGSHHCLRKLVGRLGVIASSGSGAVRGLKYPKGRSREDGCGSTTAPAFGCDQGIAIMSGATTSLRRRPMMVDRLMTLIDEFTRECLAIRVARRINS